MLLSMPDGRSIEAGFDITPIPCGVSESINGRELWRIFLVCVPTLTPPSTPTNANLSFEELRGGDSLRALINTHPLGPGSAGFDVTLRNAQGAVIPSSTRSLGPTNHTELEALLTGSLARTRSYFRARHAAFSNIVALDRNPTNEQNFVDVYGIYTRHCKAPTAASLSTLVESASNGTASAVSWSSARRHLMPYILANSPHLALAQDSEVERYGWLLRQNADAQSSPRHELGELFAASNTPAPDDLIFAILQNFELAKRLGLVVELETSVDGATLGTQDLQTIWTISLRSPDSSVPPLKSSAAVTRLYLNDRVFVVQPTSKYADRKLTLLSWLQAPRDNHGNGATVNDYAFQSFSMDHSIVRQVFLVDRGNTADPTSTSYGNSLTADGVNPLAGHGVTLIGPARDLVANSTTPAQPASGIAADITGTVYRFEDLWDGYRWDVKRFEAAGKAGSYLSIHSQRLTFKYSVGGSEERTLVVEHAEDLIYRDQRTTFKKPTDVSDASVTTLGAPTVHPALYTWNGLATVQHVPWSCELDSKPYASKYWTSDYLRDGIGRVVASYPSLEYRAEYGFRTRNVLQSGISLSVAEADAVIGALQSETSKHRDWLSSVEVKHRHTRNRPYSPGALIFKQNATTEPSLGADKRIRIGNGVDVVDLWLYPMPLDRDECRYHGLLKKAWRAARSFACVEGDLSKFLNETRSLGSNVNYFADPDVTHVSVSTWILGNPWLDTTSNRSVDRLRKVGGAPVRVSEVVPHLVGRQNEALQFGTDCFDFRPIHLRFRAGGTDLPSIKLSRSSFADASSFELTIPPGDLARLEFLPVLTAQVIAASSLYQEAFGGSLNLEGAASETILAALAKMPGLTAPLSLEIIHESQRMVVPPRFERWVERNGDSLEQGDLQVFRLQGKTAVNLAAAIQVDPRTAGSVALRATWENDVDDVALPGPVVKGTPSVSTNDKSVHFSAAADFDQEMLPDPKVSERGVAALVAPDELYCVERSCLFGREVPNSPSPERDLDSQVELGDLRHHRLTVRARILPRYPAVAKSSPNELVVESEAIIVNAPSAMLPSPPQVSHVIPLSSISLERGSHSQSFRIGRQLLRLYLRRPWRLTGKGELLAFVFDRSWRDSNQRSVFEIGSPSSAWGEDPLYRTYESETRDNISPGNMFDMLSGYAATCKFDDEYPTLIQTELSGDTLGGSVSDAADPNHVIQDMRGSHLVCVRPSYDMESKLWYVDLDTGDRNRWFRFQLARYQPWALPGFHVSLERAFTNCFSTRSMSLTAAKIANDVEIVLNTIPYSGATLDTSAPYLKDRYALALTDNTSRGIYAPTPSIDPIAVTTKAEPGNVRHSWKVGADATGVALLTDRFRRCVIATINLSEL